MNPTRKNPPSATNAERAEDISAGSLKSIPMVPQLAGSPPEARRTESALTFEDRHAAEAAGYNRGMNHRFGPEIEDRARALLHRNACEALGLARRLAAAKGPAWEAMIVWSGEGR